MTTQVEPSLTTSYLDLVGSKLRHKLGSQLNEHINNGAGSSIPAFAKAQLEKLGWKEGEGLGKRRQGMSSHIKVVKRAEGLGLGESTLDPALHQSLAAQDWWKHSVGNTLAKLSSQTKKPKKDKKKKKKKKTKKDDDDDDQSATEETTTKTMKVYTDEELFQATGGARFGMRAQTRQQAKWKRAESNISAEEEEEAKRKVEWDGMAPPQVILKDTTTTTTTTTESTTTTLVEESTKTKKKSTTDSALTTEEKEERKRDKKDKKKKRRRKDDESTEKKGDEEEDEDNVGKKSKKAKKQKSE